MVLSKIIIIFCGLLETWVSSSDIRKYSFSGHYELWHHVFTAIFRTVCYEKKLILQDNSPCDTIY